MDGEVIYVVFRSRFPDPPDGWEKAGEDSVASVGGVVLQMNYSREFRRGFVLYAFRPTVHGSYGPVGDDLNKLGSLIVVSMVIPIHLPFRLLNDSVGFWKEDSPLT